jgi:hypothetical protein
MYDKGPDLDSFPSKYVATDKDARVNRERENEGRVVGRSGEARVLAVRGCWGPNVDEGAWRQVGGFGGVLEARL